MTERVRFSLEVEVDATVTVDDFRDIARRARLGALHAGAAEATLIFERARARGRR